MKSFLTLGWCLLTAAVLSAADGEFDVLDANAPNLLHDHLLAKIRGQYDARRRTVSTALQSADAFARHQRLLQQKIRQTMGELPEKTSLKAKVTGVIERDGYRIEKVVYQSRPGHYVTANLYVPTRGQPPYPATLVACGHSGLGKAYSAYQSVGILMALNGIVALVYDPVGQGERRSYLTGSGNPGLQHKLDNVSSILVGRTTVGYQAWDGVRSVDYLLTRQEVDRSKPVGMTGNSGGGAQTLHLMALDDRIGPAAPSCHITTLERNCVLGGAGDGCQVAPLTGALGLDHPDYFAARAPKPSIILSAEQDYKDIRFTRETFAEAKRAYDLLGRGDRMEMFAHNDQHAFSKPRRETATRWMRLWLLDDPTPVSEPKLKTLAPKELQVTRSGQVLREFGDAVSVLDLNVKRSKELASKRAAWGKSQNLGKIHELIGVGRIPDKPTADRRGAMERDGMFIEKLILRRPGEPPIPALLFHPSKKNGKHPGTLYLDDRGKDAEVKNDGEITQLVAKGHFVLSIDVRGFGETAPPPSKTIYVKGDHTTAMWSLHIGKPLLGQRVEDVIATLNYFTALKEIDGSQIQLIGRGRRAGPVALHAAVLEPRITSVSTRDSIENWIDDVVAKPDDMAALSHAVPYALHYYDLPDLRTFLGSRFQKP